MLSEAKEFIRNPKKKGTINNILFIIYLSIQPLRFVPINEIGTTPGQAEILFIIATPVRDSNWQEDTPLRCASQGTQRIPNHRLYIGLTLFMSAGERTQLSPFYKQASSKVSISSACDDVALRF